MGRKGPEPDQLVRTKGVQAGPITLKRGPASPPAPSLAVEDENLVRANVDDLERLKKVVVSTTASFPRTSPG